MKVPKKLLEWMEKQIAAVSYGEIHLIIHMREGAIEWFEKISRETEKTNKNTKVVSRQDRAD